MHQELCSTGSVTQLGLRLGLRIPYPMPRLGIGGVHMAGVERGSSCFRDICHCHRRRRFVVDRICVRRETILIPVIFSKLIIYLIEA